MGTATKILTLNKAIRGASEPDATTNADEQKLWSWYSSASVVGTDAQASAKALLAKTETTNMVHEQMLTDFNTNLLKALKQGTTDGDVSKDAKNYAAIFGDAEPTVSTTILQEAVNAYTSYQALDTANQAKAKALAEARLYESWKKRFNKLVDAGRFSGTSGFANIVKCMQETLSTTAISDDTDGGESSWAVYARSSADHKAKIRSAIVAQMSASVEAVA